VFTYTPGAAGNPVGVEDIFTTAKAAKVIIDGKLVIIKNGKAYNAMGQEI
jgi:hypothetical protein